MHNLRIGHGVGSNWAIDLTAMYGHAGGRLTVNDTDVREVSEKAAGLRKRT